MLEDRLPILIKEFLYAGVDFRQDLDLPRLPSQPWGSIGEYVMIFCFDYAFDICSNYIFYEVLKKLFALVCTCANVGPMCMA